MPPPPLDALIARYYLHQVQSMLLMPKQAHQFGNPSESLVTSQCQQQRTASSTLVHKMGIFMLIVQRKALSSGAAILAANSTCNHKSLMGLSLSVQRYSSTKMTLTRLRHISSPLMPLMDTKYGHIPS